MQKEENVRTAMLLGAEAMEKLRTARVAVFGVGGVGGHICEALARAGVGAIDLFDSDAVSLSNINRQIIALHSTVGRPKVEVMRERILDINPACRVTAQEVFYLPENADNYPLGCYTYIADAVDTVAAKIELAVRAEREGVPLISSMGTGNKLDPTRFAVTDLFKTTGCPLARVMRRELKARGLKHLKVVFSEEPACTRPDDAPAEPAQEHGSRRSPPGSLSFVPSVVGLIMAGEIVKEIIHDN
ncbi:MAG: tRNA threonylcarbamoyladenosine dehydratase [Clostridia bacterium]|nr:tRNA threonylcarbamoyladenosine dehydratase [Clostridia bacterium]